MKKLKTCVFGASGYAGIELVKLLYQHSQFSLDEVLVSEHSADSGQPLTALYPQYPQFDDYTLQGATADVVAAMAASMDVIFLATPHEFSHDTIPLLLSGNAKVMDLSGAFRIKQAERFHRHYGFAHTHPKWLDQAVYGLADWHQQAIADARLVAVPGCYPTASLLALKPLQHEQLLDGSHWPVINAVSGVSGAGRKAASNTSFCEVSLQAYGVLSHRHQPEIADWLGQQVIFTPHLGNFKRGIVATITVKMNAGVTEAQIAQAFERVYQHNPLVVMRSGFPKVDDVAGTHRCDIGWRYDPQSGYLVLSSAIDNLLKGAASQALQCANLACGLDKNLGLAL